MLKRSYDVAKNNIILCIWCNAICLRGSRFKKTHYFPHTVNYFCSSMLRFSKTEHRGNLIVMTHTVFLCIAPRKHNTMSEFVIVETLNKRYSTLLKTHIWIVSRKFFKYRNYRLIGCESEAPDCPCNIGIAPLYSVHITAIHSVHIVGYSLPHSGNSSL